MAGAPVYTPFPAPDRRSVFDVDPERITSQAHGGHLVEQRADPRASCAGYDVSTHWDAVQVAYFSSYALWNYLTTPFLFTYPGVQVHEIEPWQEEGQTWRRLHVTFPPPSPPTIPNRPSTTMPTACSAAWTTSSRSTATR